jgi:hypothetical protein
MLIGNVKQGGVGIVDVESLHNFQIFLYEYTI